MKVDLELLKFLWTVGTGIAAVIAFIAVLWLRSRFATKEEFDGYVERADENEKAQNQRITVVEQELIHAPKKEDIAILSEQISTLGSSLGRDIAELRGESTGQSKLLDAIHDHLLNKKS